MFGNNYEPESRLKQALGCTQLHASSSTEVNRQHTCQIRLHIQQKQGFEPENETETKESHDNTENHNVDSQCACF